MIVSTNSKSVVKIPAKYLVTQREAIQARVHRVKSAMSIRGRTASGQTEIIVSEDPQTVVEMDHKIEF